MKHELSSIELSDSQKTVLAKAIQNGAIDKPSQVPLGDEKLTTARDILDELGIIEYSHSENTIKVSDEYIDVLQQNGLIDDMNQLTQDAQQLLNPMSESISFVEYLKNFK